MQGEMNSFSGKNGTSPGEIRMSSDPLKVVVIGLDGATFDLIHPWVKEGHLPTFKRMMEEGSAFNKASFTRLFE